MAGPQASRHRRAGLRDGRLLFAELAARGSEARRLLAIWAVGAYGMSQRQTIMRDAVRLKSWWKVSAFG